MEMGGRRCAKLQTTGGEGEEGKETKKERDVRWVEMNVGAVKSVLRGEFGFKFPIN